MVSSSISVTRTQPQRSVLLRSFCSSAVALTRPSLRASLCRRPVRCSDRDPAERAEAPQAEVRSHLHVHRIGNGSRRRVRVRELNERTQPSIIISACDRVGPHSFERCLRCSSAPRPRRSPRSHPRPSRFCSSLFVFMLVQFRALIPILSRAVKILVLSFNLGHPSADRH